jgi:4-cresol dehydrogenase (hydroxylating) flavoprotein subunit
MAPALTASSTSRTSVSDLFICLWSASHLRCPGVVTKIGLHLSPAVPHFADCEVSVAKEEDLTALVKTIAKLERYGVIQNHTSISNIYRMGITGKDKEVIQEITAPGLKGECLTHEQQLGLQKRKGWGYWKAQFAIYGALSQTVQAHWAIVQESFAQLPGAQLKAEFFHDKDNKPLKVADMPLLEIPHNGYPRLEALPLTNCRGFGGGHVAFSPLFPPGSPDMQEWFSAARRVIEAAKFDLFADFHIYGRYVIAIILVVYGPHEGPRAANMFEDLLKDGKEKFRVSEYRTHISYMDEVRSCFDFGGGAMGQLLTRLKNELDPNGILSPGKSGIWNKPESAQLKTANSCIRCTKAASIAL